MSRIVVSPEDPVQVPVVHLQISDDPRHVLHIIRDGELIRWLAQNPNRKNNQRRSMSCSM